MASDIHTALALALALALAPLGARAEPGAIRDPFAPLHAAAPGADAQPFELRALLSGSRPMANLGGMIVAPGDQLMDYTVERIDATSVTLTRAGQRLTLTLEEG